jgi:hypothetical protein
MLSMLDNELDVRNGAELELKPYTKPGCSVLVPLVLCFCVSRPQSLKWLGVRLLPIKLFPLKKQAHHATCPLPRIRNQLTVLTTASGCV